MKKLEIVPEKGYEIDLSKSDITKGIIEFKKKKEVYPTRLEDLKTSNGGKDLYYFFGACQIESIDAFELKESGYFESEKLAEAFLVLADLIRFRDEYRNGWVPDWDSPRDKYCIRTFNNQLEVTRYSSVNCIFSFETIKFRDIFYNNFKTELKQLSKCELI